MYFSSKKNYGTLKVTVLHAFTCVCVFLLHLKTQGTGTWRAAAVSWLKDVVADLEPKNVAPQVSDAGGRDGGPQLSEETTVSEAAQAGPSTSRLDTLRSSHLKRQRSLRIEELHEKLEVWTKTFSL